MLRAWSAGISTVVWAFALPTATCQEALAAQSRLELKAHGSPAAAQIAPQETHSYEFRLPGQWFAQLSLEHRGTELDVRLLKPTGRSFLAVRRPAGSFTSLSLIADSAGVYRLDLSVAQGVPFSGQYQVRIQEAREQGPNDTLMVDAERAFYEAEQLLQAWSASSVAEAVGLYQRAIDRWGALGENRRKAEALRKLGVLQHARAKSDKASELLRESLSLSLSSKDRQEEGRTLAEICALKLDQAKLKEAEAACLRALEIGREIGDRSAEGQALNNLGDLYRHEPSKALEFYQQAEVAWDGAGDLRGQAQVLLLKCRCFILMSQHQSASEKCRESLTLWRYLRHDRGQSLALTALGHLHYRKGEWQTAIDYYEAARDLTGESADPVQLAALLNSMGSIYGKMKQPGTALSSHLEALDLLSQAGLREGVAVTLLNVGRSRLAMGLKQEAIRDFKHVLEIYQELGIRKMQAYPLGYLGEAHEALGDYPAALSYLQRAADLQAESQDRYKQGQTLNYIGRIHVKRGDKGKALSVFQDALRLNREAEDGRGEIWTLANLAHLERDKEDWPRARSHMQDALSIVDSQRSRIAGLEMRASYFATVQELYEFQMSLLMQMHGDDPQSGLDRAAFELSEQSRARALTESLVDARESLHTGVPSTLLDRWNALKAQLNEKAALRSRTDFVSHSEDQLKTLDEEIRSLTIQFEEVRARIRRESPLYDPDRQPRPLNLSDLQGQVLDPETLLLEYSLQEQQSYLWAVTHKGIESFRLPARSVIEEAARSVFRLLTARQPRFGETLRHYQQRVRQADAIYWEEAGKLSQMVLKPAWGLLNGKKRMVIVSEGALRSVPFAALPIPGHPSADEAQEADAEAPRPFMEEFEVVRLPSASALAVQRAARRDSSRAYTGTVAVLADPVFESDDPRLVSLVTRHDQGKSIESDDSSLQRALQDFPMARDGAGIPRRLPSTRQEALDILSAAPEGSAFQALGFKASRATATSPQLSGFKILHFATHGLLNDRHPELSGIILSLLDEQGQPQDGFLRLHDIYSLDLPADLVVLSACSTGLGQEIRGEGLIGLVRGFLYAGASRVVASLWKVDDAATGELMKHFYRKLLQENLPPPAALRAAQSELRRQERWQSPFYWAAFVLQGEWR